MEEGESLQQSTQWQSTHRTGENTWKPTIQYIYDIPKLDYKKKKKERTRLKKGKRLKKKKFIQRRHTNDQQTFEKMLNSTNHQGNNNQKDSGILPNTR